MKSRTDCKKPLVEAAVKCSPSSAKVFHWLNEFMEDFYCAGKSFDEQKAFSKKMHDCESYFENAPEKCKDVDYLDHEGIWFQSPSEVCNSTQKLFDCFNTALRSCGLSGHSLDETAFAKAMRGSNCPSSASNNRVLSYSSSASSQFVATSMTALWWTLVVTGLAWFL
jgi:hypothetical protein